VGLDIIQTLSEHYGVKAPVFVDNAEAVTKLNKIDCQMIRLVVRGDESLVRVTWDMSGEKFTALFQREGAKLVPVEKGAITGSEGTETTIHLDYRLTLLSDGRGYFKGYTVTKPTVVPVAWTTASTNKLEVKYDE